MAIKFQQHLFPCEDEEWSKAGLEWPLTFHHFPLVITDLLVTCPNVVPVKLLSTHRAVPIQIRQVKNVLQSLPVNSHQPNEQCIRTGSDETCFCYRHGDLPPSLVNHHDTRYILFLLFVVYFVIFKMVDKKYLKARDMVYFPSLFWSSLAELEGSASRFLRRDPVVKGMMR